MPDYLAEYKIHSYMFDGGAWMQDPEPHYRSHVFTTEDDVTARQIALEYCTIVGREFFIPIVRLESLIEYRSVRTKEKNPEQLSFNFEE